MRYVDLSKLRVPTGWVQRAADAAQKVANGDDPDQYSSVWRELKDNLADLLHDKCWYCESPVDRSDNAVDHYRPKKRVSDALKPHAGYRWLAFEKSNFRYACTYCNSRRKGEGGSLGGGKGDRFPLVDENQRVYVEGPIYNERPTLLDPCDISDCRLLGCRQENGESCPTSDDQIELRREEISIDIYHLNYEPTCKSRHRLAVRLLSDVADASRLFDAECRGGQWSDGFKRSAGKILRAIKDDEPYSGEMRFLLRGQRSAKKPWIDELLRT